MENLSHIELDTRDGYYYTSMIDADNTKRFALLTGPHKTHDEALNLVKAAKDAAIKVNDWYAFNGFGKG